MTDPNRTAVAVVLLQDDPDARRLVACWPRVAPTLSDAARLSAWARVSGVPLSIVRRTAQVLLRNGLCREDGTVDPDAAKVIEHLAAAALRSPRGRS